MVEAKEVVCPYCAKRVFFPMGVAAGYCSACGRIIDIEGASQIGTVAVSAATGGGGPAAERGVTVLYNRRPLSSFNNAVELVFDGPVSKTTVVSAGRRDTIMLPEGEYRLSAKCYYNGGVNSEYVYGSFVLNLVGRNRSIEICNGSSLFSRKLIILDADASSRWRCPGPFGSDSRTIGDMIHPAHYGAS